jgi:hypothetical protein
VTRTITGTRTATGTRTLTPTVTPTVTRTPSSTPTATCATNTEWDLSPGQVLSVQQGGNLWLTKTVPTDQGWGVFWLREDPGAENLARVYYAHVDFDGQIDVGPMLLAVNIPRIPWRGRYYNAAWHTDHYGFLVADRGTLYYHNLTRDGVLSARRQVGPTLFVSSVYDQEADSDIDAYPDGFVAVIEGNCSGHSCSYAFRLNSQGIPQGSPYNLVDFDLTHQFWPRVAFDGNGFAVISVKDINISNGGVVTKYFPYAFTTPAGRAKVVPSKEYLWDEYPDIAWNGDHFGALWTEVTKRPSSGPPVSWQIHFGSFRRSMTVAQPLHDRVLDVRGSKSPFRWNTNIHALGNDWVVHYSLWNQDAEPDAVFQVIDSEGNTHAHMSPFTLSADALGSSIHTQGPYPNRVGVARGDLRNGVATVTFHTLDPPVCR